MFLDALVAKLIDLGDQTIEEISVVRNQDERAVIILESLLQDVLGLHVEMVGGLIEDEEVDWLEQQLDHTEAHSLASRQHLDFLLCVLATKHECAQEVGDLLADLAHSNLVYCLIDSEFLIEQ